MPATPLFREEETDTLLFLHSLFRKALARHHAHRLELFLHLQFDAHPGAEDVDKLLGGMDILPVMQRIASDTVVAHPLFAKLARQQGRVLANAQALLARAARDRAAVRKLIDSLNEFDIAASRLDVALTASLTDVDELTGLLNQTTLERDIKREQAQARRTGSPLSVALIDADHFKSVNDTYGHGFGDHVLEVLADHFEQQVRPRDRVYRYGGEEFMILLPETAPERAVKVMDRLRRVLASNPITEGETTITQTVSVGVAELGCDEDPDDAIERADVALYHAKEKGRNTVVLWSKDLA